MSNFIQRFFWSCAGVDIEVLEACPSDQRKYTSIGVIIFLVASFAALAMYFAASTIVESKIAAIGIALLWGILILMLDRLIVSTIKNERGTAAKAKWIAAIPRIVLATIIAIVISRPIEVRIFSDEIIRQIKKDEILEYNRINQQLIAGSSLGLLGEADSFLKNKQDKLIQTRKEAEKEIPTPLYRTLKTSKKQADSRLAQVKVRRKQQDYKSAIAGLEKLRKVSQWNDVYYEEYLKQVKNPNGTFSDIPKRRLKSEFKDSRDNWKILVNEVERKIGRAQNEVNKIERKMTAESNRYYGTLDSIDVAIEAQMDTIQMKKTKEDSRIKVALDDYNKINQDSIPSFFTQMKALSNLGYETDDFGNQTDTNLFWWAKWFILLLFFVVEISPVFVKIIAPPGAYDEAFQDKQTSDEQIFRDNLHAKAQVANIHRENWKKEQLKMYQNKKGGAPKAEEQEEEVIEN